MAGQHNCKCSTFPLCECSISPPVLFGSSVCLLIKSVQFGLVGEHIAYIRLHYLIIKSQFHFIPFHLLFLFHLLYQFHAFDMIQVDNYHHQHNLQIVKMIIEAHILNIRVCADMLSNSCVIVNEY